MIQVPGKIFIFGEYSVMNGGEAILAAVKPEFQCGWSNTTRVHPESPAGKFLKANQTQTFVKVEEGLGAGFGSSTAELIAANEYIDQPWSLSRLWTWYRENCAPASGADLVVQSAARKEGLGTYLFQNQGAEYRLQKFSVPEEVLQTIFIFQAPHTAKIPTHQNLNAQKDAMVDVAQANAFVKKWTDTFRPELLTEWADYLSSLELESKFAHQIRKSFEAVEGVRGVKGCGAGLNDVFLASVDSAKIATSLSEIHAIAEKHQLKALGAWSSHG